MLKEGRTSKGVIFWVVFTALVAQLPSGCLFLKVAEIQDIIAHDNDIIASAITDNADIAFIAKLKKEAGFDRDVQILVGPYKRLFGNSFQYQLEKHFVFVEQSQTIKETFLILIDKTFYNELNHDQRKGVLAHEMWHIFNLSKGLIRPRVDEERDADSYAVHYVSADTMLELCKKYEGNDLMRQARVENLERHRLSLKSPNAG